MNVRKALNATLLMIGSGVLIFGSYVVQPATAQTYKTWQNPDASQSTIEADVRDIEQRLIDLKAKLNVLIDDAERGRSADPVFLRDLRDLANSFDRPRMVSVLLDEFSDGDYNLNPIWTVTAGRYWIEKDWGLRNALENTKSNTSNATSGSSSNDAMVQIFGNILNKALGGRIKTSSQQDTSANYQTTAIYTSVPIGNAFAVELDVSSWVNQGGLSFGPYQGYERNLGYRLIYTVNGAIELAVKSRNGLRIIASNNGPFVLEDSKLHTIKWRRDREGLMHIELDGDLLIEHSDLSFRDPFSGFGMATKGGDFIVKRIAISAIPE